MTVKELITRLLDMPMSYDVILADNNIHTTEHGKVNGYCFDIEHIKQKTGVVELQFDDWRIRINKEKE